MTLLEEIQKEAVDSKSDLGSLLRKCKVLAAHLGSQPLADWLIRESNGYADGIDVPDYRIWPLQLRGNFLRVDGLMLKNIPIPMVYLPKDVIIKYQHYKCRQSIASIEQTIAKDQKGILRVSVGDLTVFINSDIHEYQNCLDAWAEFPIGHLVEILNAVRNRILDFSLALWKENPNVGKTSTKEDKRIELAKVTQIFKTTIYGGTANLVGNAIDSTVTVNVVANDFSSLESELRLNGVSEEDINGLHKALEADRRPEEKNRFGPQISSWIADMVKKAAGGGWGIAIGAAANLLADAISKYYGLK